MISLSKSMNMVMGLLLVAAFVYIMFLRECSSPEPCDDNVEYVIEWRDSLIPYPVIEKVPEIKYRDTGSTKILIQWKEQNIDTLEFIKQCEQLFVEYYAINYYEDVLVDDTNGRVIVKDSVSENRIVHRSFLYEPVIHTHYVERTERIYKAEFYGGIGLGRSPTEFGLAPSFMFISKKRNAYSAHYDILNRDLYVTMYWCFNKGRKKK